MRQGDGTDLLGPSDPRSASIGVIYVAPNDDRQSVLTAILTQDKLGIKQVVVVLPDQNKAFQRPVDFDGLKNMRRGLKAEIVFIAPSGSGPSEFARQRRFPVFSSLDGFSQSVRLETIASGNSNGNAKRKLFGIGRKQEFAAVAIVQSSRVGEEGISSLPDNGIVRVPQEESYPPQSEEKAVIEENGVNGQHATELGRAGEAAGFVAGANDQHSSSTLEQKNGDLQGQAVSDEGLHVNEETSSNGILADGDNKSDLAGSNGTLNPVDPGPEIITFSSSAPRPKITRKFPVPNAKAGSVPILATASKQPDGSNPAPANGRGNSGKIAAVAGGATAVGLGTAKASSAASGGGSIPPVGNTPAGPGGVGGTSRQGRILLAILLGVLTVLLIGGITIAAIPGGFNNITHAIPGAVITATVTITPDSKVETNTFQVLGVTGKPDPSMRQVSAHIISYTSNPPQSKTVQSTGSIPGGRATGTLTFLNSGSTQTFGSTTLRGSSGVPISFDGPVTVYALPGIQTVTGFAVNIGSSGNIRALDISGACCAAGITVKNGEFSGGQDPQPNSIVQQSDIDGAASALTASLTPSTQATLQKQVLPNEKVVPNTLQCNRSTFTANHAAGDHAPNVTVTVAITCKEEVYDQQAALTMGASLLTTQVSKDLGPNYQLTGNILTTVTRVTEIDTKGTVAILVKAEGVWVYHFDDATLTGFKNHIANMSEQDAITYLKGQTGVKDVKIDISSGTTLPDAQHITIEIVSIPGIAGSPTPVAPTPIASSPSGIPSIAPTHPTPTSTQGLGGG